MPKMFIHVRENTFTAQARADIAARLTDLGVECERLRDTPQVRAGVWVYFVEHAAETVFRAGRPAEEPIMSLKAYTIKGGLDDSSRTRLIEEATHILGQYSGTLGGQIPVYVGVFEIPEENWGMYGKQVSLAVMQV